MAREPARPDLGCLHPQPLAAGASECGRAARDQFEQLVHSVSHTPLHPCPFSSASEASPSSVIIACCSTKTTPSSEHVKPFTMSSSGDGPRPSVFRPADQEPVDEVEGGRGRSSTSAAVGTLRSVPWVIAVLQHVDDDRP